MVFAKELGCAFGRIVLLPNTRRHKVIRAKNLVQNVARVVHLVVVERDPDRAVF